MVWNDSYAIGVEKIDRQHKALFAAVSRLASSFEDGDSERSRRVCAEAVKYIKSYTLMHFADEEEYQRSVGYEGYERHKRQHESLVSAVLSLERELADTDFAPASVKKFEGVLTSWLIYHVMNSDQAIVGKVSFEQPGENTALAHAAAVIEETAMRLFRVTAETADAEYAGGFSESELFCLVEAKNDKRALRYLFAMDGHSVLSMLGRIAGYELREADEMVCAAAVQLCGDVAARTSAFAGSGFAVTRKKMISFADAKIYAAAPDMLLSALFTSELGALVVCAAEM